MNAPVLFIIAKDLTQMQIDSAGGGRADVGMIEEKQEVDFSVDAFPYRVFHGAVAQVRNAATTVQNVVTYDVVGLGRESGFEIEARHDCERVDHRRAP